MAALRWIGPPPPAALAARLSLAPARGGAAVVQACIVATATARSVPLAPPGDLPWMWVCKADVPLEAAKEAIRRKAYDVVPLGNADLVVARAKELLVSEPSVRAMPHVIAVSAAAREMLKQLARAARTQMAVLITGETGTGKEIAARLIWEWSPKRGPWIAINCAAIPNSLMEAELFGSAKGAFTDSVARAGKLMAAKDGTVFLDEIDDTSMETQLKLLRVLEDKKVTPLGATEAADANFRILAATNRELDELIGEKKFLQDLYERLAIVSIHLPPLRERREDIPALAHHFVQRFYQEQGTPHVGRGQAQGHGPPRVHGIAPNAVALLQDHRWPGNVRELRNVIYGALVEKLAGDELLLSDLRRLVEVRGRGAAADGDLVVSTEAVRARIAAGRMNLRAEIATLERTALKAALEWAGGSPSRAARLLGEIGRGTSSDPGGTVRAMMRRLGL